MQKMKIYKENFNRYSSIKLGSIDSIIKKLKKLKKEGDTILYFDYLDLFEWKSDDERFPWLHGCHIKFSWLKKHQEDREKEDGLRR